jgi:oligopeptide transport system substrate-binding protein
MAGIYPSCRWTLLLLLVFVAACQAPEPEPLTFNYHLAASPSTLDPAEASDAYALGVVDRIFEGLLRLDRVRGAPELEIASAFEVSADGLVYEVRLRSDVRFHNGRRVEASDFKYSWERLLDPNLDSENAWLLDPVRGAREFQIGEAEEISGVEVISPDTLRIHLTEPFKAFGYHLADPSLTVVPKEEVERLGESFRRKPVGSGPYQFREWVRDTRIVLEAFEDHAWHQPQVRRLVYEIVESEAEALRLFREGRLDLVERVPPGSLSDLRREFPTQLKTIPSLNAWQGFCFRCDEEPFDDSRVRRAFSLAVDRDVVALEIGPLRHTATKGFISDAITGQNSATLTPGYNLKRARTLLVEAGFPNGKDFPEVTIAFAPRDRAKKVGQALQLALKDIGISIELRFFSPVLDVASTGDLQIFQFGWTANYPHPHAFLFPLFHSQGSLNYFAYANPNVDRLLDVARLESNNKRRIALYQEAERIIIEDAPCVALYTDTATILIEDRWQGILLGYNSTNVEIELATTKEKP